MVVRSGRERPAPGFLPVFSVGSEDEAHALLVIACPRARNTQGQGDFVARELAGRQTLDRLQEFGDRLQALHDRYLIPGGRCDCSPHPSPPAPPNPQAPPDPPDPPVL